MPSPAGAQTPADFVSMMRALRGWACLTYGELEGKAQANGDKLPQSTIASALSRASLPREATVAAFVTVVEATGCTVADDAGSAVAAAGTGVAAESLTATVVVSAMVSAAALPPATTEPARAIAPRVPDTTQTVRGSASP